jgi:glucose-1-phosphate cytidylyltransferase
LKVVLFCGGLGLRLQEAGSRIPKPLISVGDWPILLHLMKYYAHYGHRDFILCLGHNAVAFKQYFLEYNEALQNDFVLSEGGREVELLGTDIQSWRISFVDTGRSSNIGTRLRAVRKHLEGEEWFLANYGDQLTDAPLPALIEHTQKADAVAGMLCVKPTYSTHVLAFGQEGLVTGVESMRNGRVWINGGFFTFRHDIFDYMREGEELVEEPFSRLIAARRLLAYRYEGFWAPMDTLKDRQLLEALAETARPPWAVWAQDEPVTAASDDLAASELPIP